MKKVILPAIAVVGIMAMSFTSAPEAEVKVVKTEFGEKLTNVHLLSLEDLQAIEAMTVSGAAETSWVHTSVYKDAVQETVHKTTDVLEPAEMTAKLNTILVKY